MKTIGTYDAKTHLSRLLKEVEAGEIVIVTRRDKPIARIIPYREEEQGDIKAVIARMKSRRAKRQPVTTEEVLAMRDEGRMS